MSSSRSKALGRQPYRLRLACVGRHRDLTKLCPSYDTVVLTSRSAVASMGDSCLDASFGFANGVGSPFTTPVYENMPHQRTHDGSFEFVCCREAPNTFRWGRWLAGDRFVALRVRYAVRVFCLAASLFKRLPAAMCAYVFGHFVFTNSSLLSATNKITTYIEQV